MCVCVCHIVRVRVCRADGEVSNTREVVALCKREHEATGARVFTFGIGNDVSQALVRDAAVAGAVPHRLVLSCVAAHESFVYA